MDKWCHLVDIFENNSTLRRKGELPFLTRKQPQWSIILLYLSQLLFDSLKVLCASRVKTKGAARVHLGERHLLWRGAMKRLDRKNPRVLEDAPHVERAR